MRLRTAALLAMASCGGTTSDSAAPRPDVFDLAIAVPRDTPSLHVPGAWIEGVGAARGCIPGGAMGPATCASVHEEGAQLVVSFTLGEGASDRVISVGETQILVNREGPRSRLRSEADVRRYFPDAAFARRVPIAGGYAVVLEHAPGLLAVARLPIAGDVFDCVSHHLGRYPRPDEADRELALCLGLRPPVGD